MDGNRWTRGWCALLNNTGERDVVSAYHRFNSVVCVVVAGSLCSVCVFSVYMARRDDRGR